MTLPDQLLHSVQPHFISTAPLVELSAISRRCTEARILLERALLPEKLRHRLIHNWAYVDNFCTDLSERWDLEDPDEGFRQRRYYDYYTMLPALLCEHVTYTTKQLLAACPQSDLPRRWQQIWMAEYD